MSIRQQFLDAFSLNASDITLNEIRAAGRRLIQEGRLNSYCVKKLDEPLTTELSWEERDLTEGSVLLDFGKNSASVNFFIKRTVDHIHRVQNTMVRLTTKHRDALGLSEEDCRKLLHNVMSHDRSKFSEVQWGPYIGITEYYNGEKKAPWPEGADLAIADHYREEIHHPEKFDGNIGKWSKFEALECVCDLWAMSEEKSEKSCRDYYQNKWRPSKAKYFYDDYNWAEVTCLMEKAIGCLEIRKD